MTPIVCVYIYASQDVLISSCSSDRGFIYREIIGHGFGVQKISPFIPFTFVTSKYLTTASHTLVLTLPLLAAPLDSVIVFSFG